jgi:hypothetical protein
LLAGGIAHDFNNLLTGIMEDVRFSVEIRGGSPGLLSTFRRPERTTWVV